MFDVALKSAGAQVVLATSSDGNHPPENIIDGYGFIINILFLIQYINCITNVSTFGAKNYTQYFISTKFLFTEWGIQTHRLE